MPCFIDLEMSKFAVCCVPVGKKELCLNDALQETSATRKDGSTIYVPFCKEKGHAEKAYEIADRIEKCRKFEALGPLCGGVFIQPEGMEKKCLLDQWMNRDSEEEAPVPQPPALDMQQVCVAFPRDWEWVSDTDMWMNCEGKTVPISELENGELITTVRYIVKHNFSKVTKRIQWVKQLYLPEEVEFRYPEGVLDVGYKMAGEKLEDFEYEANERGLI